MLKTFLEILLADDKAMDIPLTAPVCFFEIGEGVNPNFPDAKAFIHYVIGQDISSALLKTKVEDLILDLDVNVNPQDWLQLTTNDDMKLVCRARDVVSRTETEEGTNLTLDFGKGNMVFSVKESRKQIKKWSERAAQMPPPGMMDLLPQG